MLADEPVNFLYEAARLFHRRGLARSFALGAILV